MTIDQYLASIPDARSARLKVVIATITRLFPDAEASMLYKMPTYRCDTGWVAVANRKHYISVYTCAPEHIEAYKRSFPKTKSGKGCLNFTDKDEISMSDMEVVINRAMTSKSL